LKSSRTTYFDSLTGITEIESGESSEELKIKGKPELQKNEKSRDLKKHVIKRGITRVAHCLRIIATQLMTLKQSALANNDQFRILLDFDVSVSRI
jgi:hypothetical protein